MGRPARFDEDAILDAALRLVARAGPLGVTMESLASELGGNIGSLYHRFASKELLMGSLWIRCARQGHEGLIASLADADLVTALHDGVLHYPRWSRTNLPATLVLAAHGREQLAAQWPTELGRELTTVNDDLLQALRDFGERWFGACGRRQQAAVTMAILDLPIGTIRRYLVAGKPAPTHLDPLIVAAARATLEAAAR